MTKKNDNDYSELNVGVYLNLEQWEHLFTCLELVYSRGLYIHHEELFNATYELLEQMPYDFIPTKDEYKEILLNRDIRR